ncbi:hypothetical protein Asi02nite_31000 [Asanoa siamensis]|uniref:Uncharacterized protein n=1 Tax=Asanoa siamensis TaxID=926357 RepID=A0ABQ4CRV8_9ACTN|nr:hypothetical protein Asi02nite_31000 [Asanoa siamensis]
MGPKSYPRPRAAPRHSPEWSSTSPLAATVNVRGTQTGARVVGHPVSRTTESDTPTTGGAG